MTSPGSSYSELLKSATRNRHEALEALDFFHALTEHRLPRQSLVSYLRGMGTIHAAVETTLLRTAGTAFGPWCHAHARLDDVLATLANARTDDLLDIPGAVAAATNLADQVLLDSDCSAALLGYLYVLEGSRLGGQLLCRHIAAGLGLDPTQVVYCTRDHNALQWHWSSFKHALDALELDERSEHRMVRAAQSGFDGIAQLARNCFPYDPDALQHRITAINPEAGRHAMPQLETEIVRALRCAQAAWKRFPYLDARYGERGRRFTHSDSCWLVTLYDLDEASVLKSLLWLRRVLASRGLPTPILENHLEVIDRDIVLENPERARRASGYRATLSHFHDESQAHLQTATRQALVARYEQQLSQCPGNTVARAADILIGAHRDTAIGIEHAWDQVFTWMTDRERFSPQWTGVVGQLAEELETVVNR